jgi:hypothetical protein
VSDTATAENTTPVDPAVLADAAADFVGAWRDDMLADQVGPGLTCLEAGVLADLLTAAGAAEAAGMWLRAHAVDSCGCLDADQ